MTASDMKNDIVLSAGGNPIKFVDGEQKEKYESMSTEGWYWDDYATNVTDFPLPQTDWLTKQMDAIHVDVLKKCYEQSLEYDRNQGYLP